MRNGTFARCANVHMCKYEQRTLYLSGTNLTHRIADIHRFNSSESAGKRMKPNHAETLLCSQRPAGRTGLWHGSKARTSQAKIIGSSKRKKAKVNRTSARKHQDLTTSESSAWWENVNGTSKVETSSQDPICDVT